MPNDILRDFQVACMKEAQPHLHLSPHVPAPGVISDSRRAVGLASGGQGAGAGARGPALPNVPSSCHQTQCFQKLHVQGGPVLILKGTHHRLFYILVLEGYS